MRLAESKGGKSHPRRGNLRNPTGPTSRSPQILIAEVVVAALVVTFVPYLLLRRPVSRIARAFERQSETSTGIRSSGIREH